MEDYKIISFNKNRDGEVTLEYPMDWDSLRVFKAVCEYGYYAQHEIVCLEAELAYKDSISNK